MYHLKMKYQFVNTSAFVLETENEVSIVTYESEIQWLYILGQVREATVSYYDNKEL